MLNYFIAKFDFDTAENEPAKICKILIFQILKMREPVSTGPPSSLPRQRPNKFPIASSRISRPASVNQRFTAFRASGLLTLNFTDSMGERDRRAFVTGCLPTYFNTYLPSVFFLPPFTKCLILSSPSSSGVSMFTLLFDVNGLGTRSSFVLTDFIRFGFSLRIAPQSRRP